MPWPWRRGRILVAVVWQGDITGGWKLAKIKLGRKSKTVCTKVTYGIAHSSHYSEEIPLGELKSVIMSPTPPPNAPRISPRVLGWNVRNKTLRAQSAVVEKSSTIECCDLAHSLSPPWGWFISSNITSCRVSFLLYNSKPTNHCEYLERHTFHPFRVTFNVVKQVFVYYWHWRLLPLLVNKHLLTV